jgi:DNA replication and repair protein RecF
MTARLTHIYLTNFRNFEKREVPIGPYLTLIIGQNAHGKTSLLEGNYCTVYGTGFRETRELELVRWEEDANLVEGIFSDGDHDNLFQLKLQKTSETKVQKSFYVNEKNHKSVSILQTCGSFCTRTNSNYYRLSSRRRRYFDEVLSAPISSTRKTTH